MSKQSIVLAAALAASVLAAPAWAQPAGPPRAKETVYFIPPTASGGVQPNPFLANGVAVGREVPWYMSAGIGPAARNTGAPASTPNRYIDYDALIPLYPGFNPTPEERAAGVLPAGVTITEAQGVNNMARIQENLAAAGLSLADITYMRIYLETPTEGTRADYAGWNDAYRKYMANVDRVTGEVITTYAPVAFANRTRPARANIEVESLPVAGWLIEIEAVASYPTNACSPPFLCR